MENFINIIKKNDKKLTDFFESKQLKEVEKTYNELENQHQEIKESLKNVNYLLDLIEKHQIETSTTEKQQNTSEKESWLSKLKKKFEEIHLINTDKLSSDDIAYLQKEKGKLIFEKEQLEKEHHHIHQLIAKANSYLTNLRNSECEEITKGYDIAKVGEKLLEHFGRKIEEEDYYFGRKKVVNYLEETFSLNRIKANELFELLEKSRVLKYKVDYSNMVNVPVYENFDEFSNFDYVPMFGNWLINA